MDLCSPGGGSQILADQQKPEVIDPGQNWELHVCLCIVQAFYRAAHFGPVHFLLKCRGGHLQPTNQPL